MKKRLEEIADVLAEFTHSEQAQADAEFLRRLADDSYDAENPSRFSIADCEAAVGQRAMLPLTGTLVEAGVHDNGPWVKFAPDPRWGFPPGTTIGMDLDAFELAEEDS